MLKLYGHEKSRAFRVLWLLQELGLEYEHIRLNFGERQHQTPDFLRLNPSGKVPVLIDGEHVIHESSAIMLHLHDGLGRNSELYIASPQERTELYQWLFYGSCELEQGLWTAARHTFILPEDRRIAAAAEWGKQEFTDQLNYLSQMLGSRRYLINEKFSVADILVSQILLWATQQQKIDLGFINIKEYLGRCVNRDTFRNLVRKFKEQH